MPTKIDNVPLPQDLPNPAIWKFTVIAFLALCLTGLVVGAILGAIGAQSVGEWFGLIVYMTLRTLFWGCIPALTLGALWYSRYYRAQRMSFIVYLSAGPILGLFVGLLNQELGFGFGIGGFVFLLLLHLLVRRFPKLVG